MISVILSLNKGVRLIDQIQDVIKIVRLDFVDTDPQPDIGRVLVSYYLVNPDMEKLEEIRKKVEARFDDVYTDDLDDGGSEICDEPTFGGIDEVEELLKENFMLISLDTEEIKW